MQILRRLFDLAPVLRLDCERPVEFEAHQIRCTCVRRSQRRGRPMASAAWGRIAPKLEATGRRVASLEWEPERRNSFVPYTAEARHGLRRPRRPAAADDVRLQLPGPRRGRACRRCGPAAAARYGTGNHGVRALAGSILSTRSWRPRSPPSPSGRPPSSSVPATPPTWETIGALVGPGDTVFVDKYAHASIVDGCRLSGATVVRFRAQRHRPPRPAAWRPPPRRSPPGHRRQRLLHGRRHRAAAPGCARCATSTRRS